MRRWHGIVPNKRHPAANEQIPASEWNAMVAYVKNSVDADKVDGCDAGLLTGNVYKVPSYAIGTILYFTTPVALTIAASRIVGRKATGGIVAMTAAEVKAILAMDHGADLTGLGDDDHTQYLLVSGSRAMTGNLNMGHSSIHECVALRVDTDAAGFEILEELGIGTTVKLGTTGYAVECMTTPIHMHDQKIVSLADPTSAQDAATKAWVEANFNTAYTTRWPSWTEVTSKPSTFTPSAHNQSADTITSGTLPVARGGTGVTGSSSVADVNADKVDNYHAAAGTAGYLLVVPSIARGSILAANSVVPNLVSLNPGTSGYQLTSSGAAADISWAAASDLIFSDTHCPKCGKAFEDGEILVLYLIGHNEVGDILTIPMHQSCANAPKKTVTIKRKVMEDQYILDELTGETKVQRVQKMQEKTVTKKKLKDDSELDNKTGEFWQMEDGKRKKKLTISDATEEVEKTISEVIYEDVEFTL